MDRFESNMILFAGVLILLAFVLAFGCIDQNYQAIKSLQQQIHSITNQP